MVSKRSFGNGKLGTGDRYKNNAMTLRMDATKKSGARRVAKFTELEVNFELFPG